VAGIVVASDVGATEDTSVGKAAGTGEYPLITGSKNGRWWPRRPADGGPGSKSSRLWTKATKIAKRSLNIFLVANFLLLSLPLSTQTGSPVPSPLASSLYAGADAKPAQATDRDQRSSAASMR
jgi:hypothetical protein